ncbi:hypothetical protein HGRIS_014823 [Hohenbuehelia grisea]|uniref:Uncharacterized protein n=1 Tax=Hohenbuehelia grisea TaxID=104357 RepID=A0ABR3IQZ2_9AGAR
MPPKPRPFNSKAAPDAHTKELQDKKAMPPPPQPPKPLGILEPEMNALSTHPFGSNALSPFTTRARDRGIRQYAPHPPHSLTSSLGREVEKYDQLCDAMEAHLLRAISVLQRDLARSERRIKEAEAAAAALLAQTKPKSPTEPPIDHPMDTDGGTQPPTSTSPTLSTAGSGIYPPPKSGAASGSTPMSRRQSMVALSSLHRSPFPLKLDLSSDALRLKPEDVSIFQSGLASPVTLAPKSARPMGPEFTPDFMAAFASSATVNAAANAAAANAVAAANANASANAVATAAGRPVDIDLTLSDHTDVVVVVDQNPELTSMGNSADKPIELDLDAMELDMDMAGMGDLFGDSGADEEHAVDMAVQGVFDATGVSVDQKPIKEEEDKFGIEILDALGHGGAGEGTSHHDDEIFASLASGSNHADPASAGNTSGLHIGASSSTSEPSPGTILEGFANSNPQDQGLGGSDSHFDLMSGIDPNMDLSQLGPDFMNLGGFLDMNGEGDHGAGGGDSSTANDDIVDLTK